jgi:hypothetical protein
LIHRDHRKGYESASALGQIIWREGPAAISAMDLDLVARKGLRDGSQLLRFLEQKQPGHTFKRPQEQTLRLLDAITVHASLCPDAADLRVAARSGAYVIRGEIAAATDSARQHTTFLGPQEIEKLFTSERYVITQPEALFQWLDPENLARRRGGR